MRIPVSQKELKTDTKTFDRTMKECCTEPGQKLENLYKNIDKSITHRKFVFEFFYLVLIDFLRLWKPNTKQRETMEAKSREKELRYTKIRDKYAQSMRPVNQQKVRLYCSGSGKCNLSRSSRLKTGIKAKLTKNLNFRFKRRGTSSIFMTVKGDAFGAH